MLQYRNYVPSIFSLIYHLWHTFLSQTIEVKTVALELKIDIAGTAPR